MNEGGECEARSEKRSLEMKLSVRGIMFDGGR